MDKTAKAKDAMNPRKNTLQAHGAQPKSYQNSNQARQPNLVQRKTAANHHPSANPLAPPVYRPQPQPKVLQTKMAGGQPSQPKALAGQQPNTLQPRRQPIAPLIYSPHPTPRVLQLKKVGMGAATSPPSATPPVNRSDHAGQALRSGKTGDGATRANSQSVLQRSVARFPSNAPKASPGLFQQASRVRALASGVVQRAEQYPEPSRQEKAAANMTWNEFVPVGMPSAKHILEDMVANDANGKKKVSIVENAVALEAVQKIGEHVKKYGWKSADDITIEWVANDKCFKVTYKQNQWMTHPGSGQLWPLRGPDIFSPPDKLDVRDYYRKWKSGGKRPDKYMG